MTDARGSVYNFSSVAVPGLQPGYDRPDPVVAIAAAPDGPGCWLLQRDGKVFAAPASLFLAESPARNGWTAVDIAPTPSGQGYWALTSDFGVFSFGDAQFQGSAAGVGRGPAAAIVAEPEGDGYWQVTTDGAVYGFGAPSFL